MARSSATKKPKLPLTELAETRATYTRLLRETRGRSLTSTESLALGKARTAFLAAQDAALAAAAAVWRTRPVPEPSQDPGP